MKMRKCGNCANAECQDGEYFCEIDGNHVDPECCPRLYDGFCWSKREKQEKTPEEISAMRSEFGRRGGLARAKNRKKIQRTQLRVHKIDRDVLFAYGQKNEMTIVGVIHHLCCTILQNHPDIKKPDGWVD